MRRSPGRILSSMVALALAAGAVGVMAVPAVSSEALRQVTARDGLADLIIDTTPLSDDQLRRLSGVDGIARIEPQVVFSEVVFSEKVFSEKVFSEKVFSEELDGAEEPVRMVGMIFGSEQTMDTITRIAGRVPEGPNEVIVSPGFAASADIELGAVLRGAVPRDEVGGEPLTVVGIGETVWWSDGPTVYLPFDTALARSPSRGANHLVVRAGVDGSVGLDTDEGLRSLAAQIRSELAEDGGTFLQLPVTLPGHRTPIDDEIEQVSSVIGLLGMAAGLVALVLLSSTTNTLIAQRTREVAVMRALGARPRAIRRRLRRVAFGISATSLLVGIPLGIGIANVIATMVLEEFVGISPEVGWDWKVSVGTAAGILVGARIVSARSARRVAGLPLAEALRDRDGAPFGRSWTHRLACRVRLGRLRDRMALRAAVHRPARSVALVAQVAAGVGAIVVITGMAASVNAYNASARAPWSWEARAMVVDSGLHLASDTKPDRETGIWVFGETADWEVDVFGLDPATGMFDPNLRAGTWLQPGRRGVVVSEGFARQNGLDIGEDVLVELASGPHRYPVIGLAGDFARSIYVDREVLAADLGAGGRSNVVYASTVAGLRADNGDPAMEMTVVTAAELAEADGRGRKALVGIFAAIGLIVAGVAALAVVSSLSVNLFERRHELAAMQAIGARRAYLRGLVARELTPLALGGVLLGLVAGWLGTVAIVDSFEAFNAVDIPTEFVPIVAPASVLGVLAGTGVFALVAVRGCTRRSIAVTLRGAA